MTPAASPLIVRALLCHAHVAMGLRCFGSLFRCSDRAIDLRLHDDGSLTPQDADALRAAFPDVQIIPRAEADARVLDALGGLPHCREFRARFISALKMFDTLLLGGAGGNLPAARRRRALLPSLRESRKRGIGRQGARLYGGLHVRLHPHALGSGRTPRIAPRLPAQLRHDAGARRAARPRLHRAPAEAPSAVPPQLAGRAGRSGASSRTSTARCGGTRGR